MSDENLKEPNNEESTISVSEQRTPGDGRQTDNKNESLQVLEKPKTMSEKMPSLERTEVVEESPGEEKVESDYRPSPRQQVETGYLVKKTSLEVRKPNFVVINGTPEKCDTGQSVVIQTEVCGSVQMSSMEEEALRERIQINLLKQCSDYLANDGTSRYTKDAFRRIFMEKVRESHFCL